MVVAKVYLLNHLQPGHRDEAVQRNAHAAHHAGRNGSEEGDERSHERSDDRNDRRRENRGNGSVPRNRHAAYGFTVRGVGAAAEERARNRTYAVAEKRSVQTGIFQKIAADDRRKILMVGNVFRKHHERNGRIRHGDRKQIRAERAVGPVIVVSFFERFHESEIGIPLHIFKLREIDYFQRVRIRGIADRREDRGHGIARKNTDNERNEFQHLLAVHRAGDYGEEGYKPADQRNVRIAHRSAQRVFQSAGSKIADRVTRKRQTDDSHGRAHHHGGHQFVQPVHARFFHHQRDDHVYKPRKACADNQSEIPHRHRNAARERRHHRSDERKRRAEEHRASEFREKQIHDRTYARAEQSGGLRHTVPHHGGHGDRRRKNREQLLQREYQRFSERRFVFHIVNEFHKVFLLYIKFPW